MRYLLIYFGGLLLFVSCHKDCFHFDSSVCPGNPESVIYVKFNMDSLNGGFTEQTIKNIETTGVGRFYDEPCYPITNSRAYDTINNIYVVWNSYYCCTENHVGIKFFNRNTGTVHIINEVQFHKERTYDYCCGNYYYIESFKYDGVIKTDNRDTIIISND